MHPVPEIDNRLRIAVSVYFAGIAAVLIGALIGVFVIVPAISDPSASHGAVAAKFKTATPLPDNPDPFPYRTPTPDFGPSAPPSYAAAAKKKAQEAFGDEGVRSHDEANDNYRRAPSSSYRYPPSDRTRIIY